MKKAILLAMNGPWSEIIYSGEKEYEYRQSNVKNFKPGMKIYFYDSLPIGKVTGEAIIESVNKIYEQSLYDEELEQHADYLVNTKEEVLITVKAAYKIGYNDQPYAIKLKDIKKYGKPKNITDFISWSKYKACIDYNIMCNDRDSDLSHCRLVCFKPERELAINRPPQSFMYVVEEEGGNGS
jgi:hypothetical protein